jgi:hypothetical protein
LDADTRLTAGHDSALSGSPPADLTSTALSAMLDYRTGLQLSQVLRRLETMELVADGGLYLIVCGVIVL